MAAKTLCTTCERSTSKLNAKVERKGYQCAHHGKCITKTVKICEGYKPRKK